MSDFNVMPLEEFKTLVNQHALCSAVEYEIVDRIDRPACGYDEQAGAVIRRDVVHAWGFAHLTTVLGATTVVYTEAFSYDEGDASSFQAGVEELAEAWSVTGVLVGCQGRVLSAAELSVHMPKAFGTIDHSAYQAEVGRMLDIVRVAEVQDERVFTLEVDNAPSLRFKGDCIAQASDTRPVRATNVAAGSCTQLNLYKTTSGKYVCHSSVSPIHSEAPVQNRGAVCATEDGVRGFFGHSWLAKELYEEAGIEDIVLIA